MIGVFDSGVGGLSVLREIRRLLPAEPLVYVADSGHAPYGDRPVAFIEARVTAIAEFLVAQGARALVVACNTATVTAVRTLRSWCPLPIVAIEPAIKPAMSLTRSGVVGVLATRRTVASPGVARLCEQYGQGRRILLQACPGLVEQVERGELEAEATRALLRGYIEPLLEQGADTLVLGCTHYPFLATAIRELVGAEVSVLDPAAAVARELCRRVGPESGARPEAADAAARFFSSGDTAQATAVISLLWGRQVIVEPLPTPAEAIGGSGARPESALTTRPLPATLCPVCGEPNVCAPAHCGSFEVDCWCSAVRIEAAALERVPTENQGLACLCPRCASACAA